MTGLVARATAPARASSGARYSLWQRPERLTDCSQLKLSRIAEVDERTCRGSMPEAELRLRFDEPELDVVVALLITWLLSARRCHNPAFGKLADPPRLDQSTEAGERIISATR